MEPLPARSSALVAYLGTAGLIAAATLVGSGLQAHLTQPDLVMLYLLAICAAAARFGRGPAIFAAALSVGAYNFFFVLPLHSLAVEDERNLLTFVSMFVLGWGISALTDRNRMFEAKVADRERQSRALYALSRELSSGVDEGQLALALARKAAATLQCGVTVTLDEAHRKRASPIEIHLGPTTEAPLEVVPIRGRSATFGQLLIGGRSSPVSGADRELLQAFAMQTGLALERAQLVEAARLADLRATEEELRSALLSAVSHDLRTPLAAITGAATTLLGGSQSLEEAQRKELLETICEESERLERLVVNLLEVTRVEASGLKLRREWVPVEELVGAALTRVERLVAGRAVEIRLDPELPLVLIDPVLFEQVLFNLLENAAKYTPSGTPVAICAQVHDGSVVLEIADRGPGLTPGTESRIFEKFFRVAPPEVSGAGLGLAIVRAIVQAHGGSVLAQTRPGGGSVFQVAIPIGGTPPTVEAEEQP